MPENEQLTPEQMNEALFTQFVFMFRESAYQHMGKVKNPMTDKIERDLEQARHSIDVLAMLEAKTRGNLSEGEKQMLEHTLYELRLNFVDEMKKGPDEKSEETDSGEGSDPSGDGESKEESEGS